MPEIADGLVEIRGVAREPGYRSKIAVESHAQGVDPVGACVGPRGSRVRMVVSELRGEKIDIIPWNNEPARFVAKALSPARVREVYLDDDGKEATVVVPDDQLALAIGKEGMNARLAARLTGWKIDIQSDTEFAQAGGRRGLRRRRRRGRGHLRPLRRDPLERQALPERRAARLEVLRRAGAPGARAARAGRRGSPIVPESEPELEALADAAEPERSPRTSAGVRADRARRRGSRRPRRRAGRGRGEDERSSRAAARVAPPDECPTRHPGRARRRRTSVAAEPVRTCAGCGRRAPQGELHALRRPRTAQLVAGREAPGRGAYTCRRLACFERAAAQRAFARVAAADRPGRSGARASLH